MENAREIVEFLRAGFCGFWIVTQEQRRAKKSIKEKIESYVKKDGTRWSVKSWDCCKEKNPTKPIQEMANRENTILFMDNLHWFIDNPQLVQFILNSVDDMMSRNNAIIVLSHKIAIPPELEKEFVVMNFDLPCEDQIVESIDHVADSSPSDVKYEDIIDDLVNAGKGLTQVELENSLSLSLIKADEFDTTVLNSQKCQIIEKSGILEIEQPEITFDDVLGYENIRNFVMSTIDNPKAKGILMLGPPGCGKTMFMKALVGTTGKIGINFDFGKLFSKYVGDTDARVEAAIKIIEAIGDCIVLVDEFEKQFAGAGSSGDTDSGVTRRATGRWLRFMQERSPGIYIIATCNSFKGIPPEYLRAGRWDTAPFFIDLPTPEERVSIFNHYIDKYELDEDDTLHINPDMWTGAEIEACCSIASLMNIKIEEAAEFIVAQAKTMGNEINALREWAEGNTIPASKSIVKEEKRVRRVDV